jgi:hypothetical protein
VDGYWPQKQGKFIKDFMIVFLSTPKWSYVDVQEAI